MAGGTTVVLTPTTPPVPAVGTALHTPRTTAYDVLQRLTDYAGSSGGAEIAREASRALLAGYREFATAHHWSYFYQHGRLNTNAQYTTGTVAYLQSSGTYPYQLTLTGGTWPSWAASGSLRIGTVTYDVATRVSDTVLTLDSVLTPATDLDAGTSYTLYQDTYTMPADFVAADQGFADISWGGMDYVHPSKWLQVTRYYYSASNTPRFYTFTGDPRNPGRICLRLFPFPDSSRTVDFVYQRRPRVINIISYTTGTATVASGTTPSTVTGTSTVWTANMAGSILRLSADQANLPTGLEGATPYADERTIGVFTSATEVTVDVPLAADYTAVKYRISDPIDVEDGAMLNAFVRCCEKHLATQRTMKNLPLAEKAYLTALVQAREADSRSFATRVAGMGGPLRQRMATMPRGADIS